MAVCSKENIHNCCVFSFEGEKHFIDIVKWKPRGNEKKRRKIYAQMRAIWVVKENKIELHQAGTYNIQIH